MRRTVILSALLLVLSACASTGGGSTTSTGATAEPEPIDTTTTAPATTTSAAAGFPVSVSDGTNEVTLETRPEKIVSLSSTATEMLFAVGAGDQVVAVDEFSTVPEEAPVTDLSGFTPNLEAILGYEPDLVVISFDPGDLQAGLAAVDVPSLLLGTAANLDASYQQLEVIGAATGHVGEAAEVVVRMQADIEQITSSVSIPDGITFYHEVDATFYSATSASFIGQMYGLLGLVNIADDADDGSGFPQLSSEYIVSQDPDIIFLADVDFGVDPESLPERPGWEAMTAVENGAIVGLDSYLASNWGPSVVDLLQTIADSVTELVLAP